MNKSYKSVWNETTETYVAASETARGRGKSSRNQKALVAALLAAGVGFGTAVKSEAAVTPNSFAAGILGTNSSNSDCISSADGATVTTSDDCHAPTQEAGIVSFDASGNAGSYFTVTDPNTAHIGAGGVDQMRVTNSGVFMLNTLDMGGKKITNLAAGSVTASSTDAVTGAQLYGVTSGTAVLNSAYIKVNGGAGDGSDSASVTSGAGIAIGINAHADTGAYTGSIAIGQNATAANNGYYGATALGSGAFAAGAGTAIGYTASATGTYSAALGRGAFANASSALALGGNASATSNGAIAIGAGASATAGVALGQSSVATSSNTVSVGSSTQQRQIVNVAAGQQATDAVNYGQLQAAGLRVDSSGHATNDFVAYDDTTNSKVTLGGASGTTLTNVAAGAVSASSTDAVNGSQLYATNQNVEQNTAAIAQNTSDISTNASNVAQNTSDIAQNMSDIGSLNTQVGALNGEMANVVAYDSSAHDKVTLGGASGTTLTNVAAGALSSSSTDAVNGAQLFATNANVSNLQATVNSLTAGGNSDPRIAFGAASGVTLGAQNTSDPAAASGTDSVAIGGGSIANTSAVAVGALAGAGSQSTAIGEAAQASGDNAAALGYQSAASGLLSVALGNRSTASGSTSIAVGNLSTASATGAVALGNDAIASQANTVSLGYYSVADQANTVSVGSSSLQRRIVNVAAGTQGSDAVNLSQMQTYVQQNASNPLVAFSTGSTGSGLATANGSDSIAVGSGSIAVTDSIAMGSSASASGSASLAFGFETSASGTGSVAEGYQASASGNQSTALGTSANATGTQSVALGYGSVADRNGTVSVGTGSLQRQIVNVAAGTQGTDAVNLSQMQTYVQQSVSNPFIAISGSAAPTVSAAANNFDSIAIGNKSLANLDGIAIGTSAIMSGGYGLALGYESTASGSGSVAEGMTATASGSKSVGIGATSNATGAQSVALGASSSASGTQSVALGYGSVASRNNTVSVGAVGSERQVVNVAAGTQGTDAVNYAQLQAAGLKTDSSGHATNSFVAYDDTTQGTITLAGASGTTLTNLAAGTISASSTDAVNGSQLYVTNQNVAQNTAAISQNTSDISAINSQIADLGGGVAGAVAYDSSTHDKVTLSGASGTTLTNVAAGAVSASSTDAVNGSQLYTTNQSVAQNAAAIAQNTSDISTNAGNIAENTSNIAQNTSDIGTLNSQVSTINGEMADVMKYDTSAHDTVTLGGASGTTLTNVAAGAVSASSTDAVNGSQLYTTNQNVAQNVAAIAQNTSDISTNAGNIAQNTSDIGTLHTQVGTLSTAMADVVKYDTSAHDTVTLSGAAGTTLSNVKAGVADMDAVNVAQLKAAGLTTDASGNVSNSFVAYDDATKGKISLGGGTAGTALTNVSVGALSASSTDAVNGSQLYATNQSVAQNAAAIAQNSSDIAQNASNIAQNTSDIAQNSTDISNLDTRVTTVESSVSDLANQLNSGTVGLVQQDQTSGALTVASSTGGSSVDFTGTAGARELLGVAAGTTGTSAVNLGQLSPVVASLGGGAQVNADGSITSPTYHMQGGTQTTVGGALDTLDTNLSSLETAINNGSIGMVTQDSTSRDLLVGATTDGLRVNMAGTAGNRVVTGVAAGAVSAASIDAVNGSQLYANAASTAAALGGGSSVNADGTVSAPSYSVGGTTVNNVGAAITNIDGRVTQNTSDIASLQTAVGTMSGSVANAVSYDSSAHNQVTLGGSSSAPAVKLTNLQDGELSATSTDAVTGAQLWNTNQQLSDLTQSVQNQQQTGNSAMSINAGSQPAATATGNNAVAVGGGSQASGDNSVAIGSGSVADEANTVSVGSQGNERRITNVANGTAPTDAVNLGQMQSAIGDTARAAYSGVAAATALTMIPEVDPGKTLAVGVAGGTYKGYQAAAVGASARITQNLKIKLGAGISGSETTVGAGASYQW